MIVWVASYPRSGSTFLRIVLHRLYGVQTSVVYDVDGVADRVGAELVGAVARGSSLAAMRASSGRHFVKTHRQCDADVDPEDSVILLVRDGRDAVVSWARLVGGTSGSRRDAEMLAMITDTRTHGTGSWANNVSSWLRATVTQRTVITYDELIRDPSACALRAMAPFEATLKQRLDAALPTFEHLQRLDPVFFRTGRSGGHCDGMSPELAARFWAQPGAREMMALLDPQQRCT